MASVIMYKKDVDKHCAVCGRPIIYGFNGAQVSECCIECRPITYSYNPTPVKINCSYDELNALEDRCLHDWID